MTPAEHAEILERLAEAWRVGSYAMSVAPTLADEADALGAGAEALRRGTCGTCRYWVQEPPRRPRCAVNGLTADAEDYCSWHMPTEAR